MYYLRTKPAASAIQFTVDKSKLSSTNKTDATKGTEQTSLIGKDVAVHDLEKNMAAMVCSLENKDDCIMCGS